MNYIQLLHFNRQFCCCTSQAHNDCYFYSIMFESEKDLNNVLEKLIPSKESRDRLISHSNLVLTYCDAMGCADLFIIQRVNLESSVSLKEVQSGMNIIIDKQNQDINGLGVYRHCENKKQKMKRVFELDELYVDYLDQSRYTVHENFFQLYYFKTSMETKEIDFECCQFKDKCELETYVKSKMNQDSINKLLSKQKVAFENENTRQMFIIQEMDLLNKTIEIKNVHAKMSKIIRLI